MIVILLVEDDAMVAYGAEMLLSDEGHKVLSVGTAEGALALLEQGAEVHLLFTDIDLGFGMNGLDLARQVAKERPATKVIVTSGRLRPDKATLPEGGKFLLKPYSWDDLRDCIADLMKGVEGLHSRANGLS